MRNSGDFTGQEYIHFFRDRSAGTTRIKVNDESEFPAPLRCQLIGPMIKVVGLRKSNEATAACAHPHRTTPNRIVVHSYPAGKRKK